MNKIKSKL